MEDDYRKIMPRGFHHYNNDFDILLFGIFISPSRELCGGMGASSMQNFHQNKFRIGHKNIFLAFTLYDPEIKRIIRTTGILDRTD